jgi:hypothetical protein
MDSFELRHDNGKLIAIVVINGTSYEKDVTDYFENENAFDGWLDFRLFNI